MERTSNAPHARPRLPSLELLAPIQTVNQDCNHAGLLAIQGRLLEALLGFGIAAQPGDISKGPTVTRYEFYLDKGVRMQKVLPLRRELSLASCSEDVFILAPVPGKQTIGIDVANTQRAQVTFREVIDSPQWNETAALIPVALGKEGCGQVIIEDLAEMQHLLIGGTNGSGKSVCIASIVASILYRFTPFECRLLLFDQRTPIGCYDDLPHLILPTIKTSENANRALLWLLKEMVARFDIFAKVGARNIASFNRLMGPMSYIVVIIDELADFMPSRSAEMETSIAFLSNRAHEAGIHLVVTTALLKGTLLTAKLLQCFPARVSLRVRSKTESRLLLNDESAELLTGDGDFLYSSGHTQSLCRVQGAFITDDEMDRVVEFVVSQAPFASEAEAEDADTEDQQAISAEEEELVQQCLAIMREEKRASVSLFQRRLRLGYTQAATITRILEDRGYLAPAEGARPREILRF